MKTKKEAVTVSFHYLTRYVDARAKNPVLKPFTQAEFDALAIGLLSKPKMSLATEEEKDTLRYRNVVPIENLVRVDQRTMFGVFKAAYWGHAYENTEKGKIPAESISLRPFHFLIYLSESGKIYIASQYLGLFGGYVGLQKTLTSMLPDSDNVGAHSFRLGSSEYLNAEAKEVKVSISKNANSITSPGVFRNNAVLALKKHNKDDDFEKEVSRRILPFFGRPIKDIKQALAKVLKDDGLMDIEDSEILDCTVIADINGRRKVIHMFENGNFATRFHLDISLNPEGHPPYEETKNAILDTLKKEIISRKENV